MMLQGSTCRPCGCVAGPPRTARARTAAAASSSAVRCSRPAASSKVQSVQVDATSKQQHPLNTAAPAWRSSNALASLAAAAACLLLQQPCAAEELSIAFPASGNPEIREAQKTMVESWAYVDNLFVEAPQHTQWAQSLQKSLAASFKARDAGEVTAITRDLLAQLGDPYTRLLQDDERAALEAEEEGKIVATGLGLSTAPGGPQQQVLVVSFVVEGSPAAQAGVQEGDAVLSVGGRDVQDKELRDVYKLLANEADVTLARQPPLPGADSSSSSTAASSTATSSAGDFADTAAHGVLSTATTYTVHLKAQPLEFEPAQYGIIDLSKQRSSLDATTSSSSDALASSAPAAPTLTSSNSSSSSSSATGSSRVGYLKVLSFSSTAHQAVAQALQDIAQQGAQQAGGLAGLIVDLRDNPGGIVEAGVEIAQDFLHAGQVLCVAVDKNGQEEVVVLPEAHTLTELPLAVLVNHSTASTSELLAGALHDELGATLIGTTSFGKGKSQRVVRLADGKSTLLVSTLKYFTPRHTTIDNVGLQPDVVCKPDEVLGQQWVGGQVGQEQSSLLDDPCIRLAAERFVSKAAA